MLVSNTTKPIHELNVDIVTAFNHYFEIISANTTELNLEAYKLRHQVYCVEKGFFPIDENGLEQDEYDARSCHYLIKHRSTGLYMATVRLVLPDKNNNHELFPIEKYSKISNKTFLNHAKRDEIAELSRYCISKTFRRRTEERDLIITNDLVRKESARPNLMLALFACTIRMSVEHDIKYWYAIMEPALYRIVKLLDIHFIQIGDPVNYHGLRTPYAIHLETLLNHLSEKNLAYWNMLTNNGQFVIKT